jgi:kynureninase
LLLTGYLEYLLRSELSDHVTIFTPSNPDERGCQLSLSFKIDIDEIFKKLQEHGIMCDVRRPNVMRIAPTPLYNSFYDVYEFVTILKKVLLE